MHTLNTTNQVSNSDSYLQSQHMDGKSNSSKFRDEGAADPRGRDHGPRRPRAQAAFPEGQKGVLE